MIAVMVGEKPSTFSPSKIAGFDQHLVKPVDPEVLTNLLESL
jgi:hypothetical protein